MDIILGGDLNASVQWDDNYGGGARRLFFERLKDFKLEDSFKPNHNRDYVQTLGRPRSPIPWQKYYVFIRRSISSSFIKCEVIDNDVARRFCDHSRAIITLAL